MVARAWAMPMLAALMLAAACNRQDAALNAADAAEAGGRYAGVGIYPAAGLWAHVEGAPTGNDAAAAGLADDDQIIVVVDRRSGEVRQCGNHSGFCVAMNPWSGRTGAAVPALPARLDKHAAELEAPGVVSESVPAGNATQ